MRDAVDLSTAREAVEILEALDGADLAVLLERAEALTVAGHGPRITYSPKVFIPLTRLCRDVCHYCTFASKPRLAAPAFLMPEQVISIARAGKSAGCREALFTLGDQPEARYPAARAALQQRGHPTTLSYLAEMARLVLDETGLLPHLNPGIMGREDYRLLRPHAASMGLMLESASERLCAKGGPHHGSPDKLPWRRLDSIAEAGAAAVPFTTGILIGIGETRRERLEAMLAIREIHRAHGHIQEVIIQNFRAKADTRMANHPEPSLAEHQWSIAVARLIFGPEMTLQAPPNLHRTGDLAALIRAGINDWGGVSPLTPDHVNPEAPWPHLEALEQASAGAGRILTQRLAVGPVFARNPDKWVDAGIRTHILRAVDARGLPDVTDWTAGRDDPVPSLRGTIRSSRMTSCIARAAAGERLGEAEIVQLFWADGGDLRHLVEIADDFRRQSTGEQVTYVINRNINYTNICLYKCGFCAFAKGSKQATRGPAYRLDLEEIGRRAAEAQDRGATEVCLQGGIHPDYSGSTYLEILAAVRAAAPGIHIHAFSPLEVTHGAQTLGLQLADYLARLKFAGLASLPGTAAEVLHPDVRSVICPDKVDVDGWLDVMRAAHAVGLRSTATIMFGHVDNHEHWGRHLALLRALQEETGGFTEFVPLPFVHMESPLWRKGRARSGPTYREALLMHAIGRIVLGPTFRNIQVSWVKMGRRGAAAMLAAGANDLGGVLMDESITRTAGGRNGQLMSPAEMRSVAAVAKRPLHQRTTLYASAHPDAHRPDFLDAQSPAA